MNNKFLHIENHYEYLPLLSQYLGQNTDLLYFTMEFFLLVNRTKFSIAPHHKIICDKLNELLNYTHPTNHLIINIPPRHSKTELAVVSLISYAFALNPACEFMHFSSSEALINRNAVNIRRIIESEAYKIAFPEVELTNNAKGSITTTQGGVLYASPFFGQITGFGCGKFESDKFAGAMIIDDPIKTQDALSDTIREKVNFTWSNTLISRKNDQRTPVIVVGQRVHENDFCGYLIQEEGTVEEGGKWDVISIPAILDEGLETERALWEKRISLKNLKQQRELDRWVFETQYMQNPKPLEGLLYEHQFKTYDTIPATRQKIKKNYTDTADTGDNYLCSINYIETEIGNYILDILYTQKPMDFTEPKTAEMITKDAIELAIIESNNGGQGFVRAVERQCRMIGNGRTRFVPFHQSANKDVRIFTRSAEVQNLTYFPVGWEKMYPDFHKHLTNYMKVGNNRFDDAEDALTGTIEHRKRHAAQGVTIDN
jgi:predicted phage terminase large subunit-like protein